MAKVQKFPVGRKPGQAKIVLPDQVQVSLAELAGSVKQGLLAFSVGVGLEVFRTLLDEDVNTVVGERGGWNPDRVANRHGEQPSSITLGGRKVAVTRPRVRSSTRLALSELMSKDLSELDICALFLDGEGVGDHTVVVALAVDSKGNKHPIGLREGSTENEAVCTALLSDLIERGLDFSNGILLVLDGGKGLRAAVRKVFGSLALVQRCRIHKQRNILKHLPDHMKAGVRNKLAKAWAERDPAKALSQLQQLAHFLDDRHPGAASSLREGMEETLTITRLGIPTGLSKTLSSTNTIESMISISRTTMRNVKRWRNGKMAERWVAAGMEVAAKQFRKVNGHKQIPVLTNALAAHAKEVSPQADKIPA